MSPTIPAARKVAVRDGDDLDPNPAPKVEETAALPAGPLMPEPQITFDEPKLQTAEMHSAPQSGISVERAASEAAQQQAIDIAPPNGKPDVETRIANLEAALASLRADYDRIIPTFKTLSVNTDRLVGLLDQLEANGGVASIAPAAGIEEPQMAVSAPASADGSTLVRGVRFGMHPDKARIVIDVSSPTEYSYNIDNIEKVMMISLPHANWKTVAQRMNIGSDIVESWTYQPGPDGGSALVLQLKGAAKVIGRNALPANGGKGPRIYIDIAKG